MTDVMPVQAKAPFFRRLWVVVLLTCLLLTMPVAMIILLTGPVYRKRSDGYQPISNRSRFIYGGLLVLWLVAATIRELLQPGGFSGEWQRSADPDQPESTVSATQPSSASSRTANSANDLPSCDWEQVTDTVKDIIENGAESKLMKVTVEDYGKASETYFDKGRNIRRCNAQAVLNTGATRVTFQVLRGPSGKEIVQVQTGETAGEQYLVDTSIRDEAQKAALNEVRRGMAAKEAQHADAEGSENDADVRDEYSSDYSSCMSSGEAAKGHSEPMVRCIEKEFAFQNNRSKEQFDARMATLSPEQGEQYRAEQLAWAQSTIAKCKPTPDANGNVDPVAEPHCMLNATIRHYKQEQ